MKGVKHWNSRKKSYYSQENNAHEQYNKSLFKELNIKTGYLETCGPTAMLACVEALGYDVTVEVPGKWKAQPEDVATSFFNTPSNFNKFREIRPNMIPGSIPAHRVPQYYPYAAEQLFNCKAKFMWLHDWETVAKNLCYGNAVQLCLINPSHFISCISYSNKDNIMLYNDPNGSRHKDKDGYHEILTETEYINNVNGYAIIYYKKED